MKNFILEDNIKIKNKNSSKKISKKLNIFYNPKMKLNRNIDILFSQVYFNEKNKINLFDGMCSCGIRELKLLKTNPKIIEKINCCDLNKDAVKNFKENLKLNKIKFKNLKIENNNFLDYINKSYYNFIIVDPFGSPTPFLDLSFQKIKHNGIISITATDPAVLCGKYVKTNLRKYKTKIKKTLFYNEIGLRNLITYCINISATYDKKIIPLITFSDKHYYKIILKVIDSKTKATEDIKNLKYFQVNKNQKITTSKYEKNKNFLGKIFTGKINNKPTIKKMLKICDDKNCEKLLNSLNDELEKFGSYNIHKLKYNEKFEKLFEVMKKKKIKISKVHNEKFLIKTNCNYEKFLKILKNI